MGQDGSADLLTLMYDVARLIRVEADRRARLNGMTRAQWGLLLRLARSPGLTQKEVANLLEVEPISVARLVDRLEAGGLVERRADEGDRRVWRLHLRPAATAQLAQITRQKEALAHAILAGIGPETRETLGLGLRQMKANLAQIEPAPRDVEVV
ncbi:MAG: hypothetical protein B7Z81_12695 [Acidocella sp. 20-61-6]|nr:MAG: hypothetical protein B7Z81_12695 [Acidocella sp. 20-61-6]